MNKLHDPLPATNLADEEQLRQDEGAAQKKSSKRQDRSSCSNYVFHGYSLVP